MPAAEDDLTLLIRAARMAGDIALRHFRAGPQAWEKPDAAGPVSVADLEVDAALRETLTAARPDHAWLSEESADNPARLTARRVFVVDPIDGTRAFLDGQESFAHAIALVEDGQPVAGVVYLPAKDLLYAAARGMGATRDGQPIRPGAATDPDTARLLATRPALAPEHWPQGVPQGPHESRPSLAWRLCLVAEGRFDALVTMRAAWEWDIAAGTLILAEAGATVTDSAGRAPAFNSPARLQAGVIAAGPALHAALLARRAPPPD